MCSTESKTETGNLLYLKNEITAAETSCNCSVEVKSCDSQINVYLLHLDLSTGTPGNCNSNQKIILTDGETTHTYTCADDNNYNITLKMTSTSNYIKVQLDNRDGVDDGAFWIGLKGRKNKQTYEHVHEQANNFGSPPCLTQTGLYNHSTVIEDGFNQLRG